MVWLRCNDRYDELADLDHASGEYTLTKLKDLGSGPHPPVDGHYAYLGGIFVALYRVHDALHLRLGAAGFELTSDVVAEVTGPLLERTLVVKRAGREIAHHNYSLSIDETFEDDPTPFHELENIDFGLYLSNISKSRERRDVLLGRDQ
jgi:hypothetical protein